MTPDAHGNIVLVVATHNEARIAPRPPNRIIEGMPSQRARVLQVGSMALLGIAIALVYWPGLRGFWVRDDFFVVAYMRLVDRPWAFFVTDHFPTPRAIFRPLGYASMWFTQTLFGAEYRAQSLADLGFHIAVAVALFRVINLVLQPRSLALLCTLVFAVHPAVMATVLVWTNRFDVLAALFCLLAVRAAYDWLEGRRPVMLAATLLFALAAMASKEVGVAVLAPVFLLWLGAAIREPRDAGLRQALLALVATAVVYVAWRWTVLGTPASALTGGAPLAELIGKGIHQWLDYSPAYLSFWPRLGPWQRGALAVAAILFVTAAGVASRRSEAGLWQNRRGELVMSALALWFAPTLLQAPVAALNLAPLVADISAVEVAMQSRLYYLSIVGVVIFFAVVLGAASGRLQVEVLRLRAAIALSLILIVATFGSAAYRTTTDYGLRSSEIGQLAHTAVASIAGVNLPAQNCHVYFLDVQPPPEWSIYVSMDAIVKALEPDLNRVQDCLFHNEYPTYFYFVRHGHLDPSNSLPFRPLKVNGAIVPWLHVGGLDIVYLSPPPKVDSTNAGGAKFLAYENGGFRDVTFEIVSGRREVHFR
jgi:hypothetical protein